MASPDFVSRSSSRSQGSLFIALGIVAILTSVFFFITYAIDRAHTMHFQYESHPAVAQIEGLKWEFRPFRTLSITYSYADEQGVTHHSTESYPFGDAETIKPGQTMDIIYIERSPEKSRIAGKQSLMMEKLKDVPWSIIGLIALGGLISISIGVYRRR